MDDDDLDRREDRAFAAYERGDHARPSGRRGGDLDAAYSLGVLLFEQSRADEAESVWRDAAARGNEEAAGNLERLRGG